MPDSKRSLEVVLEFKDKLTGGIKSALGQIQKFGGSIAGIFRTGVSALFNMRTGIAALIGSAAVGGIAALVKGVADLGDKFLELSQRTGLSVETISRLKFVADQSNTDIDTLSQSLVKFQVNLGEFARTGKGEAAEALQLLSEEFQAAARNGAPASELLELLVRDFEGLENQSDKLTVAVKLFGRSGSALIPLLSEGRKGLRALMTESDRLGYTWNEKNAKAADSFSDAVDKLKKALGAVLTSAITPLLPPLTEFIDKITDFVADHREDVIDFFESLLIGFQKAGTAIQEAAEVISGGLQAISDSFTYLRRVLLSSQLDQVNSQLLDLQKSFGEAERLARESEANRQPIDARNYRDRRARIAPQIDELAKERERLRQELLFIEQNKRPGGGPLGGSLLGVQNAGVREAIEQARARARYEDQGPPLEAAGFGSLFSGAGSGQQKKPGGLEGIKEALQQIKEAGTDTFGQLKGATLDANEAIVGGLSQGIARATQNWKDFGEIAKATGRQILESIQAIIIKLTLMRLIGGAIDYFSPTPGGSTTPKTNAQGTPATHGAEIAGEAGVEAIIPLPGNRRVPVQLMGGPRGGGDTYVFISAVDTQSFDQALRGGVARNRRLLGGVAASQFGRSPATRSKYA